VVLLSEGLECLKLPSLQTFDFNWSGDQPVEQDVVLVRISVDMLLVFWLAEGSDGTYKRIGILSPRPGEGISTGDIWELES
jgi:hypothetical protein